MIGPVRLPGRAGKVWGELIAITRAHCTLPRLAIALGILLRLLDFSFDRSPWKDEEGLAENVIGRPLWEFSRPLTQEQLAPPGYLLGARVSDRLIGHSWFALRSSSLVCSIASLFVAFGLVRRILSPRAGPIALLLMAISDDLIYYAGEFKPYSADVLIALGCSWAIHAMSGRRLVVKTALAAAGAGSLVLWMSFPAIFVLAAGGLWLALLAIATRDFHRFRLLVGIGVCWVGNFVGCYAVSRRMLGDSNFMWMWWGFSFLPLPPRSWADLTHWSWTIANLPVNPGGLDTPFSPIGTGLLGLSLGLFGVVRLASRRAWGPLVLLVGPLSLAILASTAHRYPFHGRVLLFLVPALLMLIAEGIAGFRCSIARVLLIGSFLIVPMERWFVFPQMHSMRVEDSHGDQRPDLLDYLESRERLARRLRTGR